MLLLEATAAGLNTCIVSHVTESPVGRATIRRLIRGIGQGQPQVLVRVGVGVPHDSASPALTPRRPVDDVFDIV